MEWIEDIQKRPCRAFINKEEVKNLTYISLAAHNNELIIINNMDTFTAHFCYAIKQKKRQVVINKPNID